MLSYYLHPAFSMSEKLEDIVAQIKKKCPNVKYISKRILEEWAEKIQSGSYDNYEIVPDDIEESVDISTGSDNN